ncbi:unnamed protein product [Mycena citricolor]|uniref:Cytochrome b5 heme-binding domain-containing protein n=1 Tax=Mycena citricolor TaxID=2018698 RepID=A0AAD2GRN1_9AGAR|nr:unnamed protein product [Mycena citricolor]CAK5275810.1 unnamed protein product [Mycena citricolor]
MSWLGGLTGQDVPTYVTPKDEAKVQDPAIKDRMVSAKSANQPFLRHQEYRAQQEALHNAWLEKKRVHDEKIARGEPAGRLERDPTEPIDVGVWGLIKFFLGLAVSIALLGKFVTGSYTWEYETRWLQLKRMVPMDGRLFSEQALSQFNGENGKATYIAIDGDIYDVSKGKAYQPGGSYHFMAGIDAARAFGTGCFQTHRTHDLRGLSNKEWEGVQHWKGFFKNHKDYVKVGRVLHPPIDPASPVPVHCDASKQEQADIESAQRDRYLAQQHAAEAKKWKKVEEEREEL